MPPQSIFAIKVNISFPIATQSTVSMNPMTVSNSPVIAPDRVSAALLQSMPAKNALTESPRPEPNPEKSKVVTNAYALSIMADKPDANVSPIRAQSVPLTAALSPSVMSLTMPPQSVFLKNELIPEKIEFTLSENFLPRSVHGMPVSTLVTFSPRVLPTPAQSPDRMESFRLFAQSGYSGSDMSRPEKSTPLLSESVLLSSLLDRVLISSMPARDCFAFFASADVPFSFLVACAAC